MSFRGTATSQPETTGRRDETDIVTQFRARHLDLVRLATLLLGDRAAAEDVVQDVFARVWEGRDRLAAAGFTPAYLYRSVVNGCRSVHRRRGAFPAGGFAEAVLSPEPGASVEDVVLRADEDRRVLRALTGLPRRQREALILRYFWIYRFRIGASGAASRAVPVSGGMVTGQRSVGNLRVVNCSRISE